MSEVIIKKNLLTAEDMALGLGTVEQERAGTPVVLQKINSGVIPHTDGNPLDEVVDAKAEQSDFTGHTDDTGNPHGVTKAQVGLGNAENTSDADKPISDATQDALDLKAALSQVLRIDTSNDPYVPQYDYSPATKKYVLDTLIAIGSGDMAKSVYDTNESGVVDDSEALGGYAASGAMIDKGTVTDADAITENGIYTGTDVTNAPVSGFVIIQAFSYGDASFQWCYAESTEHLYHRRKEGTPSQIWSSWTGLPHTPTEFADVLRVLDIDITGTWTFSEQPTFSQGLKIGAGKSLWQESVDSYFAFNVNQNSDMLNSDFWSNSFLFAGASVTESSVNKYPRLSMRFEASQVDDPTDLTFKLTPGNIGTLPCNINIQSLNGGEVQVNGSKIWTEGNDGHGSGLDADTVDGIEGSAIVTKTDNQALHDTDALRFTNDVVSIYKGDGSHEDVTLPIIGIQQTWQDVTASRTYGVTYTNTTGKPIMVCISLHTGNDYGKYFYVDNQPVAYGFYDDFIGVGIVPPNSTYKFQANQEADYWLELR